MAKGYTYI